MSSDREFTRVNDGRTSVNTLARRIIAGIMALLLCLGAGCVYAFADDGGVKPEIDPAERYTSEGYRYYSSLSKLYSQKGIKKDKSVYSLLKKHASSKRSRAIPGLERALSVTPEEELLLKDMVPQGICRFGKLYLITAYSADRSNKSVMYVMDSKWKLVTTVTLPHSYHYGGIAYDSGGDVIWLTGYTPSIFVQSGDWSVSCITGDELRAVIEEGRAGGKAAYLPAFTEDKIKVGNRPSCLDYSNGRLWVGSFSDIKSCRIVGYRTSGTELSADGAITITGLDSKLNGFVWDGRQNLYLSYSYGRNSVSTAHITRVRFKKPVTSSVDVRKQKRKKVKTPKMNEEMFIQDGYLYIIFESASVKYKGSYNKVDRVLAISKKAWRM